MTWGRLFSLMAVFFWLFASCTQPTPSRAASEPSAQETSLRDDFLCTPIVIEGAPYYLIPVAGSAARKDSFIGSSGYDDPRDMCSGGWEGAASELHNVVFHHIATGEQHLVTSKDIRILTLEYPYVGEYGDGDDGFPPEGVLYWEIVEADSNGDGTRNHLDDVGYFISRLDGRDLHRIVPEKLRVDAKAFYRGNGTLLFRAWQERDGKQGLTAGDRVEILAADLKVNAPAIPIIGEATRKSLVEIKRKRLTAAKR